MKRQLRAGFNDLHARLEIQTLRLTLRFGVMLVVWVAVLAIILKRA